MKRKITKLWSGCTLKVGQVIEVENLSEIMAEHSEEVKEKPKKATEPKK